MNYIINENKVIELVVEMISNQMVSYYIHDKSGQYALQDKEGKCLINYVPNSKELYYDHSLRQFIEKFLPIMTLENFKSAVEKYFETQFEDYEVRRVTGAHIV